jgi:hypothetical protein
VQATQSSQEAEKLEGYQASAGGLMFDLPPRFQVRFFSKRQIDDLLNPASEFNAAK